MGYTYVGDSGPYFYQDIKELKEAIPPAFGLIYDKNDRDNRWTTFWNKIADLNNNKQGYKYKVFFLGRHGRAAHNVAMSIGTYMQPDSDNQGHDWSNFWSWVDGDGDFTWGPDAELVEDGYIQAVHANSVWATELQADIGLPKTSYCSPLTRCMATNTITFSGFTDAKTVVVENCRERCSKQTPEKRQSKTYIMEIFPDFSIEDGFTEDDGLWDPETSESYSHVKDRATSVLDRIFNDDDSGTFISITTHSGFIEAFEDVIQREHYGMHPGGVLPVVVRAGA